jgi:uncharacterized protein (DUF305 family)
MVGRMMRARYLAASLVLIVLLVAVAGVAFAYGRVGSTAHENVMGSMMGNGQTGPMVDGGGMMGGGRMMGSSDEERPFDLQFIDQMIMHHQGAIMSSEHMISDSEQPELREFAQDIQESQSEQIEQMQEWREQWYGDAAGRAFGMMNPSQTDGMMSEGMMGGSMQEVMGGEMTDAMFLRMMIPHHQLAVEMSEEALHEAEHPELRELAQTIIDEQSAEIELMLGYLEEIEA